MSRIFDANGSLHIPVQGEVLLPKEKAIVEGGEVVLTEAYCPLGHNLMSDVEVDGHKGIHFIYTDAVGEKETDIVISAVVGKCKKAILKGEPFKKGETVTILCPECRTELPVLSNCECGARIYLFFIDKQLHHNYGQSFCSRVGCVKASQLRFSQDVLRDIVNEYGF